MNRPNCEKKIGVLTFHRAENYGSAMQSYALQKYLEQKLGIRNELIDYIPEGQEDFYRLFVPVTSVRKLIGNLLKLSIAKKYKRRKVAFQKFLEKNLEISEKKFYFFDKGVDLSKYYSCVITGSDQIWNTECVDFSWAYLLEGVAGLKKISYAASMGGGQISDSLRYKKCLQEYTAISVREEYAANIINDMFSQFGKAVVSVDPTLLLDRTDYDKIAAPRRIQGDYIFLYSVYHDEKLLNSIKSMRKKWGLPIVTLISRNNSYKVLFSGIKLAEDEGPEDFLSYIKYAKFVITNSFHGTVFSMIYGKEFYYLGDYRKDPRLNQLLSMTGMQKFSICYEDLEEKALQFGCQGDFDLSEKLIVLRKKSEEYLKNVLVVDQE